MRLLCGAEGAAGMNRYYPISDDNKPEVVWQFIQQRDVQRKANRNSAQSKKAAAAVKKIEALLKESTWSSK